MEDKNAYDIVAIKKGAENPTKNFNMEFDPSKSVLFFNKEEKKTMEELKKVELNNIIDEKLKMRPLDDAYNGSESEEDAWSLDETVCKRLEVLELIDQNFILKTIHESQLSELRAENEKLKIELNNMDQLQNEIGQWQDIVFPDGSTITILNHLKKEIIELDDEVKINHIQNIGKEMADCQHLLFGIAHKLQTSLYSETRKKFEINKLRKWGKPNSDGVVEHIRNEPSCEGCKHNTNGLFDKPCEDCNNFSKYQPKENI